MSVDNHPIWMRATPAQRNNHRVRLEAGASSATVNPSPIPLAPASSHQSCNNVFLSHHSSSSLPNTVNMAFDRRYARAQSGSCALVEAGSPPRPSSSFALAWCRSGGRWEEGEYGGGRRWLIPPVIDIIGEGATYTPLDWTHQRAVGGRWEADVDVLFTVLHCSMYCLQCGVWNRRWDRRWDG